MSSLKLIVSAGAMLFSMNTNSMTPDIAASAVREAANTVYGSLQICKTQFNAAAAVAVDTNTNNDFNYAGCITNTATQIEPTLDPANLNDVMNFYKDQMAWHTENLLAEEQLTLDDANDGGIISFLTNMSSTGLAILISKTAAAMGLGFLAGNATKGLRLVKKYLSGAVEQPATNQEEELTRATNQFSKIHQRVADFVAIAAHQFMKPIRTKKQAKIASTVATAAYKFMDPIRRARARARALQQLNKKLDIQSSSSVSSSSIKPLLYSKKTDNQIARQLKELNSSSKKVGGRKTKNKRNKRNSRNSRNKHNSRRK